jgi:predicted neuraminidase
MLGGDSDRHGWKNRKTDATSLRTEPGCDHAAGAGIEAVRLASGNWALIYNDTARGRHALAVSLSDDEGTSWKWTRHLQRREPGQGSFHYPSIIQGREGEIHVTYTHHVPWQGSTIMYARFNESWIRHGDERR